MRRIQTACLSIVVLAISGGAAAARPVDRILGEAPPPVVPTIAGEVARYDVRLDPLAIVTAPERLRFALPGGEEVELERTRFQSHGPDLASWSGVVASRDPVEQERSYARFTLRSSGVTGVILLPDGRRFEVVPADDGGHRLVSVEGNGDPDPRACGNTPRPPTGLAQLFRRVAAAVTPTAAPDVVAPADAALTVNGANIDVAVFWPDGSGIWYNAIPVNSYTDQVDVRVVYDAVMSSSCYYPGSNDIQWC